MYSAQQETRQDRDVCGALLPPTGGTQRELWCDVPGGPERTDAIESPAAGPDGRLAFVNATTTPGAPSSLQEWIAVASMLDPHGARMVRSFPYTPVGGTTQVTAQFLRWVDGTRVVYVGQNSRVIFPCQICEADTLRAGEAVMVLDVVTEGALPTVVPGTDDATSAAGEPSGEAVLYTLGGSSQVYRYSLTDGTVQVVYDFGAAGIARDVHVAGGRLAAVVGGRVAFGTDFLLGPVQYDSGGVVHVVDLASGSDQVLDALERVYRRPALSSDGRRLVAEGYPLIITELPDETADTTVSRLGDLYRFGDP